MMNARVQAAPPAPMATDSVLQANVWNVPQGATAAQEMTSPLVWDAVRVSSSVTANASNAFQIVWSVSHRLNVKSAGHPPS